MRAEPFGELKSGAMVDGIALLRDASVRTAKNGSYFAQITLRDCEQRTIASRFWNASLDMESRLSELSWVQVRGKIEIFQDVPQLILTELPIEVGRPDNHTEFYPCSPVPLVELQARFDAHLGSIGSTALRGLLDDVFSDELFVSRFEVFPAATNRHHACRHGLLQHTIEVADIVSAIAAKQEQWQTGFLWRDLAVAGALLHDIGKVDEFNENNLEFDYTFEGNLLGHVQTGLMRINRIVNRRKQQNGFPDKLRALLFHLIVSHHGRGEWGASKAPMTAEAALLHHADKMSSELFYFFEAQQEKPDRNGFVFQRKLDNGFGGIGRRVYVQCQAVADFNPLPISEAIPVARTVSETLATYMIPAPPNETPSLPVYRIIDQTERHKGNHFAIARLPLLGKVAAGEPIFHTSAFDRDVLVEAKLPENEHHYLLTVEGDSMTGDGIRDGDILLVRSQATANNGDMVVANIEGESTTVKRLLREKKRIVLQASNPNYAPIVVENPELLQIQGRVIGIVRP